METTGDRRRHRKESAYRWGCRLCLWFYMRSIFNGFGKHYILECGAGGV